MVRVSSMLNAGQVKIFLSPPEEEDSDDGDDEAGITLLLPLRILGA